MMPLDGIGAGGELMPGTRTRTPSQQLSLLYDAGTYPLLEVAYYEISGRNLTSDIFTYVDTQNINKIKHILPA